jgi:hypothetical protein
VIITVLKSGIGIQATDHSFVIISEQKKASFDQYISFLITATGMQRNGTRGIKPVDWGVQSERRHRTPENLGPLISCVHASNYFLMTVHVAVSCRRKN